MELLELTDHVKSRLNFDDRTHAFDEQTKKYVGFFRYKERQRIILLIKPQLLFTSFKTNAAPGTSTVAQMRLEYTIRGDSFTLNRNPYSFLDSFHVCFRKEDQYSHDDFWLHYVSPMLDEWRRTNVDYASVYDADTYEPTASQAPHRLACFEAQVEIAFQRSIEEPIEALVKLNLGNRQTGEEYIPIYQQLKSSLRLKGATITDDGDGLPDIRPVYDHQQWLNHIGISSQPDFVAGYETDITSGNNTNTGVIYVHTIGEVKRPDAHLPLAYQSIMGENTRWLDDPITERDYTVNENGCLLSYESSIPAFRNFDFAFQKLVTQSIHAFSRRCILTDYNSIFMIEFANPFEVVQEVIRGSTIVKYVALRHFRLDTCLTDYSRVMYLAFLWLGRERIAEDQEFRQSVADYFSLQREGHNQGLLPPPRGPIPTAPGRSSQPTSTDTSANTSTQFSQTQNRYQTDIVSVYGEGESSGFMTSHFEPSSDTTFEIELNEKPFKFINATLAQQYAISLRQYVVEDIQVGRNYNSQVFCVDAAFLNEIPNVFGPVKPTLIIKIFDPSWEGDLSSLFQKYVDMTVRELSAYEILAPLNITPCLHLYGQLLDISMTTGTYNPKSSGPFIALEKLNTTTLKSSDIKTETINEIIVPAYTKMHQAGVVHGDIHPRNWLFDENGQFKILDFGSSRLSTSAAEHRSEIEKIYHYFGYNDPWMSEQSHIDESG